MQRRRWLKLGGVAALLAGVAGAGVAIWRPPLRDGHLTAPAQEVLAAVARAVLGPLLPTDDTLRRAALEAHLARFDHMFDGLPPELQGEVGQLLGLLATPATRMALVGLADDWRAASTADIQAMLQRLRLSSLALRQQIYHALRDLTNAAWFADPAQWAVLGYPGPRSL